MSAALADQPAKTIEAKKLVDASGDGETTEADSLDFDAQCRQYCSFICDLPSRWTVRHDIGDGVGYTRGFTFLEGFVPLYQADNHSVWFGNGRVVNFDDMDRWEFNAGGGYHVLIAGMSQMDVGPGQFVLAAEPIGTMSGAPRMAQLATGKTTLGQPPQSSAPVLYIEFRKDGDPINSTPWWAPSHEKVQE